MADERRACGACVGVKNAVQGEVQSTRGTVPQVEARIWVIRRPAPRLTRIAPKMDAPRSGAALRQFSSDKVIHN
jgi:hypothetical protein